MTKQDLKAPRAEKRPHEMTHHGVTRVDDYYWLRERESEEVLAYLRAENDYTKALTAHTEKLQKDLYDEILGRIKQTDFQVPYRRGDYWYYSRTEEGKSYPIYCRKKGSLEAEEQILLDQNVLARGHEYYSIGLIDISPNHQWAAYTADTNGYEKFDLYFKNLETGGTTKEPVKEVSYSGAWGNDNKTFFYTRIDEANRPHQLFRHTVGTNSTEDKLIYQEDDDRFFLSVHETLDRKYILLDLKAKITSEYHYLDADTPTKEFTLLSKRRNGVEYSVEHQDGEFLIVTNDHAQNFRLVSTQPGATEHTHWKEVRPHNPQVMLEQVVPFENNRVIQQRVKGLRTLLIQNRKDNTEHTVDFPEPSYAVNLINNEEYNSHTLRFQYQSLVTPKSVFDYDMSTRKRELKKEQEVLGGYDRSQYRTERLTAEARDGTQVPISVVYRKDTPLGGSAPMYLTAYGSYGYPYDTRFSSANLTLLDRGFVFVIAHIRGGGEMGRSWYENGKFKFKMNTFTDFIDSAEHLLAKNYSSKDKLVINGGSAGGLLMGAVVNMRPDLFHVVVADVPFVDVVTTMLDESIPLTVTEYEEWGNPNEKDYFEYMLRYSPYDNVKAQNYPHMLVTAGLNDPRVQYWEPAKWVAKLRDVKTDDNVLILKTNMGAGHAGASGRYERIKEVAFEFAFVLDRVGVSK